MGMINEKIAIPIHGHFKLSLFDAESGDLVGAREADNTLAVGGLNLLTRAINWLFIQNQNAGWGSPFTALTNLGDVYGAVGISTTPETGLETSLLAEIGRAIVTNAAYSGNQVTLDFFLPTSLGNGAIAEVGAFMQSGLVTTTLTSGLVSANPYTTLSVAALPADIPSGSIIVIGYGSGQTLQAFTANDSPISDTSISIGSVVANATYPVGTPVAYLPGTMLDRTTFAAITKTSSMTGVLEIALTLISG